MYTIKGFRGAKVWVPIKLYRYLISEKIKLLCGNGDILWHNGVVKMFSQIGPVVYE